MNENVIRKALKDAFSAAEGTPPPFKKTWSAAEQRRRRGQRLAVGAGIAAAAVLAVVIARLPDPQPEMTDEFLIAEALMNSTSWTAPSDTLMPEHRFDIYGEIPFPDPSTVSEEGSLL